MYSNLGGKHDRAMQISPFKPKYYDSTNPSPIKSLQFSNYTRKGAGAWHLMVYPPVEGIVPAWNREYTVRDCAIIVEVLYGSPLEPTFDKGYSLILKMRPSAL